MAMDMEKRRQHANWVLAHREVARRIQANIGNWRESARYALFDSRYDRLTERYEQVACAEYAAAGGRDDFREVLEIADVADVVLGRAERA